MGNRSYALPAWVGSALVLMAAIVAAGAIWALADQNRQLKQALATGPTAAPTLKSGDTLPDLGLTALSGESGSLHALAGRGVAVVGLMTTTCRFCEANLPRWEELREILATDEIAFTTVSLDGAERATSYQEIHGIAWPIWVVDPSDLGLLPRLSVPTTLVLTSDGKVVESVSGVLAPDTIETIAGQAMSLR